MASTGSTADIEKIANSFQGKLCWPDFDLYCIVGKTCFEMQSRHHVHEDVVTSLTVWSHSESSWVTSKAAKAFTIESTAVGIIFEVRLPRPSSFSISPPPTTLIHKLQPSIDDRVGASTSARWYVWPRYPQSLRFHRS